MKTLTKKQAWEKIAAAFERAVKTGLHEDSLTRKGLCWAVLSLFIQSNEIDKATYEAMNEDLREVQPEIPEDEYEEAVAGRDPNWFWWPTQDVGGSAHRAVMAQLLAESSE